MPVQNKTVPARPKVQSALMGIMVRLLKDLSQSSSVGTVGSIWFAVGEKDGYTDLYDARFNGRDFELSGIIILRVKEKDVYPVTETEHRLVWPGLV